MKEGFGSYVSPSGGVMVFRNLAAPPSLTPALHMQQRAAGVVSSPQHVRGKC